MNTATSASNYRVLARKYRPKIFAELKGQGAFVKTLTNAIKMGRVAHAFLLTGIRGIGKTTAARIIANTLNCTKLDMSGDNIAPCGECDNCKAFAKENHPDIIEIDAASRTGVGDIRELIENSRYMPLIAKYKIYIIDEVHMLSTSAFNALLKTLEEPPPHVKFILATTEIRKVPITILSRCQKFDLRRLTSDEIVEHLKEVLRKESVKADDKALKMIASLSEGSVRDSLSLVDQAISYVEDGGEVGADIVKNMVGATGKEEILKLFEDITFGKIESVLGQVNALYYNGIDPVMIVEDLQQICHLVTKVKATGSGSVLDSHFDIEASVIKKLSTNLSIPALAVLWQMLMKGCGEVASSNNSIQALEMLMVRICYLSEIPTPIDIVRKTKIAPAVARPQVNDNKSGSSIKSFKELVQLFYNKKEIVIYHHLIEDVHLVEFAPSILRFRQKSNVPHGLANDIAGYLQKWTGENWAVRLATDEGEPTISEIEDGKKQDNRAKLAKNDVVKRVLDHFDNAQISRVSKA
jgi:DNA polymerase III subunit gamma/tau